MITRASNTTYDSLYLVDKYISDRESKGRLQAGSVFINVTALTDYPKGNVSGHKESCLGGE